MKNRIVATSVIPALLVLLACSFLSTPIPTSSNKPPETISQTEPINAESIPVIFDDDGSPDGTTALLYILSHPSGHLKAAGISYGETHPAIYIQHVGRMLDALARADIPLGAGQDSPMAGHNEFPESVRQFGNDFWGLPIPNPEKTYPVQPSPELMVSILNQSASPVTIFISGPATNLAQALQLDPNIKNKIATVVMMGGAVYVPGNIDELQADHPNKVAEWNVFGDPLAASIVLDSGIDFRLVPLDATNQVFISRSEIAQWRNGGPIADFAADIYDQVLNFQGGDQAMIWDLMTAAIMLDPGLCGYQPMHLQVVTDEGNTSGQTVAIPGGEPNAQVCLEPHADSIRQTLTDVFSGTAESIRVVPPATEAFETGATLPPSGPVFRDDFSVSLQPGWQWQDENPSRWEITPDGWLQILAEDMSLFANGTQSNLLCRAAPEGDFQVTTHIYADPSVNFQQASLFLYRDGQNYVAVNRGYCSLCSIGGSGVLMEYKYPGSGNSSGAQTQAMDVFLRLETLGQVVNGYYALEADNWQPLGEAGNPGATKVCLGVSNSDGAGVPADLLGRFDFVEIASP